MESIKNKYKLYKKIKWWIEKCFSPTLRNKSKFGKITNTSYIAGPCNINHTKCLYLDEFVKLRYGLTIINTPSEKVFIKKYTVIAPNCTILTNSHRPTIGIPLFLLVDSHINDKSADVTICEDVWIGTQSTILPGVTIGRGATIGACALVSKNIPPYALVVGMPARIIGVKFSKKGILRHEMMLYSIEERMSESEIDALFDTYYNDKPVFGCEDALTQKEIEILNSLKFENGMY